MEVAQEELFAGSGCTGHTSTIVGANGAFGFIKGTACERTTHAGTVFGIRSCEIGSGTIEIRDGSNNLVQSIEVEVILP